MQRYTVAMLAALALAGCQFGGDQDVQPPQAGETNVTSIHDFTMRDIDGNDVSLGAYKGRVLLLVNVASKCGRTPQYAGLQKIYETYKDRGFLVLGFPANNFLGQEPGSNAEIKTFCSTRYNVTFPMFAKISVKGGDQHPLYAFLTSKESNPSFGGSISWNFDKFLVGRDGAVIGRFNSPVAPESSEVTSAIEAALAAPAS